MDNIKNTNNVDNANNVDMQDYAKVLDDITSQLEIIKSTISLNYELLDKLEFDTEVSYSSSNKLAPYYDLLRVRDDYTNLLLDSMDKISTINMQLSKMQYDMEVQNGE